MGCLLSISRSALLPRQWEKRMQLRPTDVVDDGPRDPGGKGLGSVVFGDPISSPTVASWHSIICHWPQGSQGWPASPGGLQCWLGNWRGSRGVGICSPWSNWDMASVTVVLELNMLDHVNRVMRTALGWLKTGPLSFVMTSVYGSQLWLNCCGKLARGIWFLLNWLLFSGCP